MHLWAPLALQTDVKIQHSDLQATVAATGSAATANPPPNALAASPAAETSCCAVPSTGAMGAATPAEGTAGSPGLRVQPAAASTRYRPLLTRAPHHTHSPPAFAGIAAAPRGMGHRAVLPTLLQGSRARQGQQGASRRRRSAASAPTSPACGGRAPSAVACFDHTPAHFSRSRSCACAVTFRDVS